MPTWQLDDDSADEIIDDDERVTTRRTSSKNDSSHGIVRGPWLENPYSSSACTRRRLKMGWFRCVARTMNLLQLVPTQTATCPAGTSVGEGGASARAAAMRAFFLQRWTICRIRTMCRILLLFPISGDIFFFCFLGERERETEGKEKKSEKVSVEEPKKQRNRQRLFAFLENKKKKGRENVNVTSTRWF